MQGHQATANEIDAVVQRFIAEADADRARMPEAFRDERSYRFRTLDFKRGFSEEPAADYDILLSRIREGVDGFTLRLDGFVVSNSSLYWVSYSSYNSLTVQHVSQGTAERIVAPMVESHQAYLQALEDAKEAAEAKKRADAEAAEAKMQADAEAAEEKMRADIEAWDQAARSEEPRGLKAAWGRIWKVIESKPFLALAPAVVTYVLGLLTPR